MPLRPRNLPSVFTGHRSYSSSKRFPPVDVLRPDQKQDAHHHINPEAPIVFRQHFKDIPAISKWFNSPKTQTGSYTLNPAYLTPHENITVPLELSSTTQDPTTNKQTTDFTRFEAPLSLLLTSLESQPQPSENQAIPRLYLAQHSLSDLPSELQNDLPTPSLISRIGKGDIYASSLWMGRPPTFTPLHRDPNPNLFVQLAGRKVVRLMRPGDGRGFYERVRVGVGHANLRGEEMFVGEERRRLEVGVWGDASGDGEGEGEEKVTGWEAVLESGDGLYVPLGWWHAVRGFGEGVNASVNWWFR